VCTTLCFLDETGANWQRCHEILSLPPSTQTKNNHEENYKECQYYGENCYEWILPVWSLGLIGNASAKNAGGKAVPAGRAVSISRLEGSRWWLRRMRSAMGFECHFGTYGTLDQRIDRTAVEQHLRR